MYNRRTFLQSSVAFTLGTLFFKKGSASLLQNPAKTIGIQLYSVRKEMLMDAVGTLKQLAAIGYKEIESAGSEKGNYYGLKPAEIKKITEDLGMRLVSGHVHIDGNWQKQVDEAAEAGQPYLVCSVLPSSGQSISNYQKCADTFSKAAEDCKKVGITFGYHNHEEEFEKVDGQTLYDILLDRTDPNLVMMEMDLGWLIVTGNDPEYYFHKYPGRFPLWHLKDMDKAKKKSTEFGKGDVDVAGMFRFAKQSGLKHFFIEQEEYTHTALESAKYDFDFVMQLER